MGNNIQISKHHILDKTNKVILYVNLELKMLVTFKFNTF